MKTWFATYYPSRGATGLEATVLASEKGLSIGFRDGEQNGQLFWSLRDITYTLAPDRQKTIISRAGESCRVEIAGTEAAAFLKEEEEQRSQPWYRQRGFIAFRWQLRIALLIIGFFAFLYWIVTPWLADRAARRIPVSTEIQFGQAVYNALMSDASEDSVASGLANDFFEELSVSSPYPIQLHVIEGNEVNAFALPGGPIVIWTGLLKRLNSYEELAALLSHEYMHVASRHTTRALMRKQGGRIAIALIFGQTGVVTTALASQAGELHSLSYSRDLETEADTAGARLLLQRGISHQGFIGLFDALKQEDKGQTVPEIISSHPALDKRKELISELPFPSTATVHPQLQRIFSELKQRYP
ncbi:MAG: M48 family metallopeptidase [Chitinophagaceae bacterium]